jgi:hypothetical protein
LSAWVKPPSDRTAGGRDRKLLQARGRDADSSRILDALAEKLPQVAAHLDAARADVLAFTSFPKAIWRQIWSNIRRSDSTGRSAGAPTSSASSSTVPR